MEKEAKTSAAQGSRVAIQYQPRLPVEGLSAIGLALWFTVSVFAFSIALIVGEVLYMHYVQSIEDGAIFPVVAVISIPVACCSAMFTFLVSLRGRRVVVWRFLVVTAAACFVFCELLIFLLVRSDEEVALWIMLLWCGFSPIFICASIVKMVGRGAEKGGDP